MKNQVKPKISGFLEEIFFIYFYYFYGLYMALLTGPFEIRQETDWESDTQQRAAGRDSNPGSLQHGQILCAWDACSTNSAKQCPMKVAIPPINVDFSPNGGTSHQETNTATPRAISMANLGMEKHSSCTSNNLTT